MIPPSEESGVFEPDLPDSTYFVTSIGAVSFAPDFTGERCEYWMSLESLELIQASSF